MFLAAGHVLGPVTGVGLLVVEEASDAELLSGRPVPASPVAGARGLVTKDAVQPVAVFSALRRISSLSALAVDIVRVVAVSEEPEPSLASVIEPVGAAGQEALSLVTLVVEVALILVPHCLGAGLAGVAASQPQAPAIITWSASEVVIGVCPLGRLRHPHSARRAFILLLLRQRHGPVVPLWFPVEEAVTGIVVSVNIVSKCVLVH
jgi:hypothetical protein